MTLAARFSVVAMALSALLYQPSANSLSLQSVRGVIRKGSLTDGAAANQKLLLDTTLLPTTDFCNHEEDPIAAYAPICDRYVFCSIPIALCQLRARTGYYDMAYIRFCPGCGTLHGIASSELTAARSTPAPAAFAVTTASALNIVDRLGSVRQVGGLTINVVSVAPGGLQSNGSSLSPAVSVDGHLVAFDSAASNLVSMDTNNRRDVFMYDRAASQTDRVSVATGGAQGNGDSISAAVSADGRFVAFLSQSTNLVTADTNGVGDVFIHDRETGLTERINLGSSGVQANQESWPDGGGGLQNYEEFVLKNEELAISDDGRYVAFVSSATNLTGAPDGNGMADVFVRDRQTGTTTRVSVWSGGNEISATTVGLSTARPRIAMSSDGRFVAFDTLYPAVVDDTNGTRDVYLHDRQTGQTTRTSVGSTATQGNGYSGWPSISGDGRYVAFASEATNLVAADTDSARDVYVRDLMTATTSIVPKVGLRAMAPTMSADGRWIVFSVFGFNMQTYLFDRETGTRTLISEAQGSQGDGSSFGPAISRDGSVLAFGSAATNLVNGDTNGHDDVFVAFPTTQNGAPTVVTGVANGISATAATLNGTANPHGTATNGFFQYGTTANYGSATAAASLGSNNVSVSIANGNISGLACGAMYHFRAVATNSVGTTNGVDATFTTNACAFTDSVLIPGVTLVKVMHVTELRIRIDAQRFRFGLTAFSWTDGSLATGSVAARAIHLSELRMAVQQAYVAASQTAPMFTDSSIVPGITTIRVVHIQELRAAVIVLEGM